MDAQTNSFSFPGFAWWFGVVEDRTGDPLKLGRVRVRVYGYYTGDKGLMPTDSLPWAVVSQDISSAANSGKGRSPTGILEGTTVWGFFLDGKNAQTPMIVGTMAGIPKAEGFEGGYKDPNGKYPLNPGESDVNRLARNEKISETVVQKKRDGLSTAEVAFGGSWTEKTTPYAAKYPYNHVFESESGHITEFDDTEGKERTHRYHMAGTFEEVHPDGTQVEKVVKDKYSITLGDEYIMVKGNVKVFVAGNASVKVGGNADLEIMGNKREHVHGNSTLNIDGNYTVTVNGTHADKAGVHRSIKAPRIDLN